MSVLGPLSLSFAMNDGLDRLDAPAWQALVLCGLARHGEGLVVCNAELEIVFSTSRGAHLLSLLGESVAGALPPALVELVRKERAAPSMSSMRLTPQHGKRGIDVHVAELRNVTPPYTALWLSEEA